MGAAEVEAFLTHLAVERKLAAVSHNQALNALVFLYKQVLGIELADINAKRAKHSKRLPVVLTQEEAAELLKGVTGDAGLVCKLLYGCGLRLAEALALRIKDVDLRGGLVTVRGGKGDKDRVISLPKSLQYPLAEHRARRGIAHRDFLVWPSQMPTQPNIRRRLKAGSGSGCLPLPRFPGIRAAGSSVGTTFTRSMSAGS